MKENHIKNMSKDHISFLVPKGRLFVCEMYVIRCRYVNVQTPLLCVIGSVLVFSGHGSM